MRLRTLQEAASELGMSRGTLRTKVISGKVPYIMWGNRYLVDMDVVTPIIESLEDTDGTISTAECAEVIGVAPSALQAMAKAGLVPYRRRGRYYRFILADVMEAIRGNMTTAK